MANDNTSKAYIEILTPAKDGAAYVDSYGKTYGEYAPNYNVNDRNTINFRAVGINISSITKIVVQNVKIYYRKQGASWSVYNHKFRESVTKELLSIDQMVLGDTNNGGLPFHEIFTVSSGSSMSQVAQLFTIYEWYIYAEYVITSSSGVSTSYGSSGTTKTANLTFTEDTSTYKLNSHVRRTVFLPKTTTGSLRARVNSSTTEIYPAFNYSTDPFNTSFLKMNIGGTVSKVALVPSDNPLAGKTKIMTNNGTKHLAKRDPSIADSRIGWSSYGELYALATHKYFTNPAQQYESYSYYEYIHYTYVYNYYGYDTVQNKAYTQEEYLKEYYDTSNPNNPNNYYRRLTGYYTVVDSYKVIGTYNAYDKQYTYDEQRSSKYYTDTFVTTGYHYYWSQYRNVTEDVYYYKEYYTQTRTTNYPKTYAKKYDKIDYYTVGHYKSGSATTYTGSGSNTIRVDMDTYRYHSNIRTTAYAYNNGAPLYVLQNHLIPNRQYSGYYSTSTTNPTFYKTGTSTYYFTYNYNYAYNYDTYTTVQTPHYYEYSYVTAYDWNYVQNKVTEQIYATTVNYTEPVYTSQVRVTDGYTRHDEAYSIYYNTITRYDGIRENNIYGPDRTHDVATYSNAPKMLYSRQYKQYWDGRSYFLTYPQYYVENAWRYDESYKDHRVGYDYRYGNYTLSKTTYSQYYKYLNMRE